MTNNIKQLKFEDIELILDHWPAIKYKNPSTLFYEGHTPLACYLLIKGNITLLKKRKEPIKLSIGSLIGLNELMHNNSMRASGIICPDSRISIIEKTGVLEILAQTKHQLKSIFEEAIYLI